MASMASPMSGSCSGRAASSSPDSGTAGLVTLATMVACMVLDPHTAIAKI